LVVNTGNDVRVSNVKYTVSASGAINNNAFATLYIDGTAVSTKTINNIASGTPGTGSIEFSGFNKVISKTAVRFDVRVSFTESFLTNGEFSMEITGFDAFDTISSAQVNFP
jgi:hypothetical protein